MSDKNYNKAEFISLISEHTKTSKTEAEKMLNSIIESFKLAFSEGSGVSIIGFGAFKIKHRKERTGRNPQTGDPMTIKASNQLTFSVGKNLKDLVNQ